MKEKLILAAIIAGAYGGHVYAAEERDRLDGILANDPNYHYSLHLGSLRSQVEGARLKLQIEQTGEYRRYVGPARPAEARTSLINVVSNLGDVNEVDDQLIDVANTLPDEAVTQSNNEFAPQRANLSTAEYELGLLEKKYRWSAPNNLVYQRDLAYYSSIATKVVGFGVAGAATFVGAVALMVDFLEVRANPRREYW
jgi:hypothetical protein